MNTIEFPPFHQRVSAVEEPAIVFCMHDSDIANLMRAATERQLAVSALQKKYEQSESIPTEQLVLDMRELLSTERVILDAIITLFVKLGDGPQPTPLHERG